MSNVSPVVTAVRHALFKPDDAAAPDLESLDAVTTPDEPPRRTAWFRRALLSGTVAVAVSITGVAVTTFGTASAPTAEGAVVSATDNQSDHSRAVPDPIDQQRTGSQKDGSTGGVAAFANTDSTSRSAVRSALSAAVSSQDADNRASSLTSSAGDAQAAEAAELAEARTEVLASDIANARAQAKKFDQERIAAVQELTKLGLSEADATELAAAGDGSSVRGVTPIAKGEYTVGAYWHEYGSWAKWHTGQDFPAAVGTPIRAVAAGIVGSSVTASWAGNNVVIHHANGGSTLYAHMQSMTVHPGEFVQAGQVIGYVGLTGRTFGPHLHFEYYPAGATPGDVYNTGDPVAFLKSLGVTI